MRSKIVFSGAAVALASLVIGLFSLLTVQQPTGTVGFYQPWFVLYRFVIASWTFFAIGVVVSIIGLALPESRQQSC